jgi:hypothetical protein
VSAFSAIVKRLLPRVRNGEIRRTLEAKCRDALAKYVAQEALHEAVSGTDSPEPDRSPGP